MKSKKLVNVISKFWMTPFLDNRAIKSSLKVSLQTVVRRCSVKKVFLKISQNAGLSSATSLKKETLAQVFSCEFCEIFKNSFFYRTPLVAASVSQR